MCSPSGVWFSLFLFHTTKQNKYKINAHVVLVGTINLTLTSFYVLILLIKQQELAKDVTLFVI